MRDNSCPNASLLVQQNKIMEITGGDSNYVKFSGKVLLHLLLFL